MAAACGRGGGWLQRDGGEALKREARGLLSRADIPQVATKSASRSCLAMVVELCCATCCCMGEPCESCGGRGRRRTKVLSANEFISWSRRAIYWLTVPSCDAVHGLHSSRKAPPARIGRRGNFRCHRENVMLPHLRKGGRYQTNYVASKATHGPHQ